MGQPRRGKTLQSWKISSHNHRSLQSGSRTTWATGMLQVRTCSACNLPVQHWAWSPRLKALAKLASRVLAKAAGAGDANNSTWLCRLLCLCRWITSLCAGESMGTHFHELSASYQKMSQTVKTFDAVADGLRFKTWWSTEDSCPVNELMVR